MLHGTAAGDATEPGVEVEFVCTFHDGMIGYLNVV
jgi:hypothetical protein